MSRTDLSPASLFVRVIRTIPPNPAEMRKINADAKGCVHFAPKLTKASVLRRLIAIARSGTAGVHASFGPYDYVTAFQGGAHGEDVRGGYEYAWTGSPRHVDSSLILRSH